MQLVTHLHLIKAQQRSHALFAAAAAAGPARMWVCTVSPDEAARCFRHDSSIGSCKPCFWHLASPRFPAKETHTIVRHT
jgi:hypothetical protein